MSTNTSTFSINEKAVEVEVIWAHLKKPVCKDYATYSLCVPYEIATVVFGVEKPDALSWTVFVLRNINEFGTFIVDGYITSLTRLAKKKRGPFEWVIITVDDVREENGLICLTGKAEQFDRKLGVPELKPLR